MRYFLDTEFNEFGGQLISLALVPDDGQELYISTPCANPGPWVLENVIPIVRCAGADPMEIEIDMIGHVIAGYLRSDANPIIIADWPDDISYFCRAIVVGPGKMANIAKLQFELIRVDAYPTQLAGAVQHNALWDARALRALFMKPKGSARRLPPGVHCA